MNPRGEPGEKKSKQESILEEQSSGALTISTDVHNRGFKAACLAREKRPGGRPVGHRLWGKGSNKGLRLKDGVQVWGLAGERKRNSVAFILSG